MVNIAYFDRFFQRRLSLRRQIVSAGSACVGNFLAQVQPAQANFQRRLSLRKKNKMANICLGLRIFFFSPVLKSPTHIGFIGVKKNGSKISHLGTFKVDFLFISVLSVRLRGCCIYHAPCCVITPPATDWHGLCDGQTLAISLQVSLFVFICWQGFNQRGPR